MRVQTLAALSGVVLGAGLLPASAFTLVKDGAPQADIWFAEGVLPPDAPRGTPTDRQAAEDLAAVIREISGAELALKTVEKDGRPEANAPAIVIGELAKTLGMKAPPKTISGDGYRLQTKGNWLMLAGECPGSTFFATSHLLYSFGCRWFIDNDIGTVIPSLKTLEVGELDVSEQPDFISRALWGPNWLTGSAVWSRHNRLGGMELVSSHNWPRWYCTTDPKDRAEYLAEVVARVKGKGPVSTSISPPDGNGYCPCERCKALDDPDYREPSSGTVNLSDRYQEFYNYIGREVKKVNPEAILCHYGYADYTLPPRKVLDGPDNLCVFLAPIRFCRVHSLSNPLCESRQRCNQMVQEWGKVEKKMGWREYNYNLADISVPISKLSIWKEDIPWLHKQGCIALNIECLYMPHLFEPHTYLLTRMAWDAQVDVDAVLDDFYEKFFGPAAAPAKAYWDRIDKAYIATDAHAGSYHGVHAFWTPALIAACQADLDAAAKAAGSDKLIAKRVAMFQMGLDNAKHYTTWREAVNRCDFAASQAIYDKWLAHMDAVHAAGIHRVYEYRLGYAPRFLGGGQASGFLRVTGGRQKLLQLPDEWMFKYDPAAEGEAAGWQKSPASPADGWRKVKTYSATLNEQKIPEQLTWMWYQTTFKTPKALPKGPLTLWFMEPDGNAASLWLDGEPLAQLEKIKARQPLDVDLTGRLKADTEYVLTVKLHHQRISELMLGGLLRPVMIFSGALPPPESAK